MTVDLGPLRALLEDPTTEVLVNDYAHVFVERDGRLEEVADVFATQGELLAVIESIQAFAADQGRRLDEQNPVIDLRLTEPLGRMNVVLPPVAPFGPSITIRKARLREFSDDDLLRFGAWDADMVQFLRACVVGRLNIVVAGGTGSGKTTVLNILTGFIPVDERVVTVENILELRPSPDLRNLVRLESRPADHLGQGEITIQELIVNAMRMRPDRIVLGEARAGEVLELLQAINTGHDGALFSIHAKSPRDVLLRLEAMAGMHDVSVPLLTIRHFIADAIDMITFQERLADGTRKIVKIAEVTGMQGDTIMLQDLFEFRTTGISAEGRVEGYYSATGHVPGFMERLRSSHIKALLDAAGLEVPLSLFTPREG